MASLFIIRIYHYTCLSVLAQFIIQNACIEGLDRICFAVFQKTSLLGPYELYRQIHLFPTIGATLYYLCCSTGDLYYVDNNCKCIVTDNFYIVFYILQESKSIGADVNWGVRFRNSNDVSSPSYTYSSLLLLTAFQFGLFSCIRLSIFQQIYARRLHFDCMDVVCKGDLLLSRWGLFLLIRIFSLMHSSVQCYYPCS